MAITSATQSATIDSLQAQIVNLKAQVAQSPVTKAAPAISRDHAALSKFIRSTTTPAAITLGGTIAGAGIAIAVGIAEKEPGVVVGGAFAGAAVGAVGTYAVVRGVQAIVSGEGRTFVIGASTLGALAGFAGRGSFNNKAAVGIAVGAGIGLAISGLINHFGQMSDDTTNDLQRWNRLNTHI